MSSPHDDAIKTNYQLAYFRRNYLLKLRDAIRWGLTPTEWELLDKAWEIKASQLGKKGIEQLALARNAGEEIKQKMRWQKGTAWANQQAVDNQLNQMRR